MAGIEKVAVMAEGLQDWKFLNLLPQHILDFQLNREFVTDGQELIFARYENDNHCVLKFIYTEETGDFVVEKNVGLIQFRDENYFSRDKEHFANLVLPNLTTILTDIANKNKNDFPVSWKTIGIDKWTGWQSLPKMVGTFQQFICPEKFLRYLNGSYVLLDYSDFSNKNQLVIFYNEYRNEIYGELKKNGIPAFTKDFDIFFDETKYVKNSKKFFDTLDKCLEKNLQSVLDGFEKEKNS